MLLVVESDFSLLLLLIVINDVDSSVDLVSDEQNEEDGVDGVICVLDNDMVMVGKEMKKESEGDRGVEKWLLLDLCYGFFLFDGDLSN